MQGSNHALSRMEAGHQEAINLVQPNRTAKQLQSKLILQGSLMVYEENHVYPKSSQFFNWLARYEQDQLD